ncbi:MAG TPA: metalloregulator ArsR/SmtB family transcription factor [Gemmatimonadaceae bacterium]|nr:metalloregulator ArsR/SmtB family transcription factor [Gemmatimonadaceae bacterium]
MAKTRLTPEMLELVADRFKVLAEPARLELLNHLRSGEMTVSDLVEESGLAQANVSRHLRLLHSAGFVKRRKDGLFVFYALADRGVFQLCDIMCERLDAETKARRRLLAS